MAGLACCEFNVKDIDASELERLGPIAQMFPPYCIFFVKTFLTLLTVALGHCRCTFHFRGKNESLEVPLPLTLFSAIAIHLMMTSFMHLMHVSMFHINLTSFGPKSLRCPGAALHTLQYAPQKARHGCCDTFPAPRMAPQR